METKKSRLLLLLGLASMLLLINLVFAAWVFNYQKSITASVVGGNNGENPFVITQEFEDLSIDTSNGMMQGIGFIAETGMTFQVPDATASSLSLLVNIDEEITDLTSGQCDYENDCAISLFYYPTIIPPEVGTEIELFDGDTFNLLMSSEHNFILRMTCVKYSCETSRDITVTLTEV